MFRTSLLAATVAIVLGLAPRVASADDAPFLALTFDTEDPTSHRTTSMMVYPDGGVSVKTPGLPTYHGTAKDDELACVLGSFAKARPGFSSTRPGPVPAKKGTPFFMFFSTDADMSYAQGTLDTKDATLRPLVDALARLEKRVVADPGNASFDSLDLSVAAHGDVPRAEISVDDKGAVVVTIGPADKPEEQKTFVGTLSAPEHDRIIAEWSAAFAKGTAAMIEDPKGSADAPELWLSGQLGVVQIVHDGAFGDRPEVGTFVEDLEALLARVQQEGRTMTAPAIGITGALGDVTSK